MTDYETFAEVKWTVGDVQTLRPDWTDEQCRDFLVRNGKHIQSSLIEHGWEVIEDLISYDEREEKE